MMTMTMTTIRWWRSRWWWWAIRQPCQSLYMKIKMIQSSVSSLLWGVEPSWCPARIHLAGEQSKARHTHTYQDTHTHTHHSLEHQVSSEIVGGTRRTWRTCGLWVGLEPGLWVTVTLFVLILCIDFLKRIFVSYWFSHFFGIWFGSFTCSRYVVTNNNLTLYLWPLCLRQCNTIMAVRCSVGAMTLIC